MSLTLISISIPRKNSLKKHTFFSNCLWVPDNFNFLFELIWPSYFLQLHITFPNIKWEQIPGVSTVACSSHEHCNRSWTDLLLDAAFISWVMEGKPSLPIAG